MPGTGCAASIPHWWPLQLPAIVILTLTHGSAQSCPPSSEPVLCTESLPGWVWCDRFFEMAHAAAVASTADQPDGASAGASLASALSGIAIASPLVLPASSKAMDEQPTPASRAGSNDAGPSVALCQLDQRLGTISIRSAGSAAPHLTCSVSCAVQTVASSTPRTQTLPAAGPRARAMLLAAAEPKALAANGSRVARSAPSWELAGDETAYRCHPALADSALHLGAVQTPSSDRVLSAGHARQRQTRVPVAMHGYVVPGRPAGLAPESQVCSQAGLWAATEAPAMQADGSSSNDVWLLGDNGQSGGVQAKGLVSRVIGAAKVRPCSSSEQFVGASRFGVM